MSAPNANYEKPPIDQRQRPLTRGEVLGDITIVRVHDMPFRKKFGESKKRNYEENGYRLHKVVDQELGIFDMEIETSAKQELERQSFMEMRGYDPGEKSHRSVTRNGKHSLTSESDESRTTGVEMIADLPDSDG